MVRLGSGGLLGPEGAECGLCGARHDGGLGAATTRLVTVPACQGGEAETVHGVCVGAHGTGGEACLVGIGRPQIGDGSDGCLVTGDAFLGQVAERRGERFGEHEESVAGDGPREVGQGVEDRHRRCSGWFYMLTGTLGRAASRKLFQGVTMQSVL